MTPVKIRGRRRQKARLRAQREERERFAATDDLDKISSTSASEATYVQSKLESLPTEIIESIFLYSRNLNLPRASLALGEILSSSGFKHVVLRAWLTDPYLDDNRNEDEAREDGKLQSGLLRCRWVDEAMFRHVLHDVRISKLTAFFQNPSPSSMSRVTDAAPSNALLGPGCPIADTSTKTITAFVENLQDNGNIHKMKWEWVSHSNEKFSLVMPDYPGRIWLERFDVPDDEHPSSAEFICDFEVADGCEIPIKVLYGPWSQSKLKFLHALMNASAVLDWETSSNGEMAARSLEEAILQEDMPVLEVFLRKQRLDSLNSPSEIYSWPFHISVPIRHKYLRLAILEGNCNPEIVSMLLYRGRFNDLRLDDSDIVEWATARNLQGDKRAAWLLEEIERRIEMEDVSGTSSTYSISP
ncbi:MAG: hypothetical protein Q9186_002165 [Xanthomendoza sp. 1 TL-2023]